MNQRIRQTPAVFLILSGYILAVVAVTQSAVGMQDAATSSSAEEVTLKRESLSIISADRYRVGLQLAPVRSVPLIAPADGVIRSLTAKLGEKIGKESEAFRVDDTRALLVVKKATAALAAAQAEQKIFEKGTDSDAVVAAKHRVEVAEAELELARFDLAKLVTRAAISGEVLRLSATEGSYVRAGETIGVVGDTTRLSVELPVDRSVVKSGDEIELKVESSTVKGTIEAVMPVAAKFEPLRDLADSLATATVVIDNTAAKLRVGQAVFTALVPTAPVTDVPALAIANQSDGNRRVQVVRERVVRNIVIQIMSRVGTDRVYVAGQFRQGDELIVSSSRELADGQPLRALLAGSTETNDKSATPRPGGTNTKPTSGF